MHSNLRPLLILMALGLFTGAAAEASLQVFPTRIFLSNKDRVANISLRHRGKSPMPYKITAVFYRMKTDGSLELVKKPGSGERSAIKMIRFSPRRVTLQPGEEQVVRVISTARGKVEEGEYRAHLRFEPKEADPDVEPNSSGNTQQITMKLKAKVSVAIPVIFRQGNPQYNLKLSGLKLDKVGKATAFSLQMDSTGNAYPVGDFRIYFTPKGGEKIQVGLVKGVSSYISRRTVKYTLNSASNIRLKGGVLRAEFYQPKARGGKLIQAVDARI